jgi:hypothetical protein
VGSMWEGARQALQHNRYAHENHSKAVHVTSPFAQPA